MATAAEAIDTKELEFLIKGFLISRPTVANANVLLRECNDELGYTFPFRKLGFETFADYLRSIPSIVRLQPHNGSNPDVYPVASSNSKHIDQLVSKQRVAPSRRKGGLRRSANYRQPPARRPTPRPSFRPAPRPSFRPAPSFVRQNQGINVRDLEDHMTRNYDKRDLSRNGIHSADDLLSRASGMVERTATKVYPKLADATNNKNQNKENCMPAGLEDDDFDDFDDEFEFYEEEEEEVRDSEEEMSKAAIELWSKALGTEESGSHKGTSKPVEKAPDKMEKSFDFVEIPEDTNISSGMIKNFRKILDRHPDGIWASQLQQLYFDQFGVTLDLLDLGYTSVIALASSLPSVFTFMREGPADWKLYDARYVSQEILDKGQEILPQDDGRYVPQTIIENIKRLLDENIIGFRSIDLLQKYEEKFRKPLDLYVLGFDKLEDFLMILKNDITLKKSLNYYIMLPKHRVVPQEALEPEKPDETLNVPGEALCIPIPDDVMTPKERILFQQLPPVQHEPDKPLMELEVRVAEVISPVHFFVTLDSQYEALETMMDDLDKYYKWEEAAYKIPQPYIEVDLFCASMFLGYWHRAKITKILTDGTIEIEYIDYGTPDKVKSSDLRFLTRDFSSLPAQAFCAKLCGVAPIDGGKQFSPEVCTKFLDLVSDRRLVAHVYRAETKVARSQEKLQLEMILYDVERDPEIVINDYLIDKGLARAISTQTQEKSSSPAEIQQPILQPEHDLVSPVNNVPSPSPSGLPSIPWSGSSFLQENSSTSLPITSVNRLKIISPYLKRFITKYAKMDRFEAQLILNKYTGAKCFALEANSDKGDCEKESCRTLPVMNGSTNGLGNKCEDIPDPLDSLDIRSTLEKMKKKKKNLNNLFGPCRPVFNISKSNLDSSGKENVNTNGTIDMLKTNFNGVGAFVCSTPESLNQLENLQSVQTPNRCEIPGNASGEGVCDGVVDKTSNVNSKEPKLSNGNKCDVNEEIDVKAILQRTKHRRLKNLFR